MFPTSLNTDEIPSIFDRFVRLIGERNWVDQVAPLRADIRGNRFLKDFVQQEFELAYAFCECSAIVRRHGIERLPYHIPRSLYPAMAFATQAIALIEQAPDELKDGLIGRIRGAFRDPTNMRGLRLEFETATSFAARDFVLDWPELTGAGTFDLLARSSNVDGLEIEVKAMSPDKGHKIHRRAMLTFLNLLKSTTSGFLGRLKVGLSVVITVPDRLPDGHQACRNLANAVRQQIIAGRSERCRMARP